MTDDNDGWELSASVGDSPDERFPHLHQPRERTGFEELNLNTFLVEGEVAAYGGLARGLNRKLQGSGGLRLVILIAAVTVLVVSSIVFIV